MESKIVISVLWAGIARTTVKNIKRMNINILGLGASKISGVRTSRIDMNNCIMYCKGNNESQYSNGVAIKIDKKFTRVITIQGKPKQKKILLQYYTSSAEQPEREINLPSTRTSKTC